MIGVLLVCLVAIVTAQMNSADLLVHIPFEQSPAGAPARLPDENLRAIRRLMATRAQRPPSTRLSTISALQTFYIEMSMARSAQSVWKTWSVALLVASALRSRLTWCSETLRFGNE